MNAELHSRHLPIGLTFALLALTGCITGPGQRMDVVVAAKDVPADVRDRADIFSIDPPTVAKLKEVNAQMAQLPTRPADFRPANEPYSYLVGPQDELRVTVFEHPELNNPGSTANELAGRTVNSDGKFFFPYVGEVQAAGRTVQQIQATLVQGLRSVIRNPQVDVTVLRFRSQRIVVSGEVRTPGTVAVTDVPPTLAEIISGAGGLGPEADLGAVTVTRGGTTVRADMYAYLYNGEQSQNFRLQAGDVVNVPDRRFNKVFVLGEVGRVNSLGTVGLSNSLVLPRGRFTLAEALSDIGGINPLSANAGQIYVIRDSGGKKSQIYHLNASSPDALLLADQFDLRRRDVVFVDSVGVVRWNRIVSNILPTADFLRQTLNDTSRALPR
jgi:polysaccharide export outer membrane protein